ncbi:MAG: MBL fold metallo-hydrolase [Bdellovibrionia bacterium]
MSLNIKFWGVRGSLPSAPPPSEWVLLVEGLIRNFFVSGHKDISQITKYMNSLSVPEVGSYGLATTCVEVNSPRSRLIIDGGSGIRNLSEKIMSGLSGRGKGPFHIYMTHFHWDHIIGLPFFTPHFVPGMEIHYYAVEPELENLIRGIFKKPYFPVPFEALQSKIFFHVLEPRKPHKVDDMIITPYKLDHPDPCWGLKVESGGKTYAHCVDTEGTRVSREDLGPDLPLYQGVDLMYFDAQYTFPELAEKANWGHSASQVGLDIAFREGIKQVLFSHHDPGANTSQIQDLKRQTKEYYDWRVSEAKGNNDAISEVTWDFAWEGCEIKL